MADERVHWERLGQRPSPKRHLYGLVAAAVLVWIFTLQPATAAPLKTAATLREAKTAVSIQGQVTPHVQLGPQFCGQTVNIMPLGNSITRGYGTGPDPDSANFNYGFRFYLFNSLNASGYDFDFVGTLNQGSQSGLNFDYDHEGHGGFRADQLVPEMDDYLSMAQPDVILLHIGTNDVAQRNDTNYAADVADVTAILNAIDSYSTETIVVLAQIIDQDRNDGRYQPNAVATYNNLLVTMAQNRINSGDKLVLVDMYNALNYADNGDMEHDETYLPNDWLHPTDSGYQKIAAVWQDALVELWQPCTVFLPSIQN
jgi:lysophospholipase L1-like esterase